tara:strand:+ start:180 stop:479 length:300 start_codon:yes stop_codon:yes gene_type:complete
MGRAIDMENDISALKIKVEKLENTVRGMVSKLDELNEKSSKTKRVDLVEDVGADTEDLGTCITGVAKDEKKKEKTDNEGNGDSNKPANSPKSKPSKKNK